MPHLVWLIDEQRWAKVIREGAHASLLSYSEAGVEYQVYVENDNIIERDVEE